MSTRFKWDSQKAAKIKKERGINLVLIKELFEHPYHLSQKNDDPEQWRAVGRLHGILVTVIYEERVDKAGPYIWIVTAWKSTTHERSLYNEN